jgi:hypothetical protein
MFPENEFMQITPIKDQRGGTLLLMTILILTAVLTVTLTASEIIKNGITMGRSQVYSTVAYFAAEAGAERILYDSRYGGFNIENDCNPMGCVIFGTPDTCDLNSPCTNNNRINSFNNAQYEIDYLYSAPDNIITCIGVSNGLKRAIELRY